MGWVNKAGGILLYALMYTTLLSVCIFYVQKIGLFSSTTIQDSTFYTFIQPFGPKAVNAMGYIIPVFKDMFTQLDSFFTDVGKTEL
jgi:membrane protein required for colicin V production